MVFHMNRNRIHFFPRVSDNTRLPIKVPAAHCNTIVFFTLITGTGNFLQISVLNELNFNNMSSVQTPIRFFSNLISMPQTGFEVGIMRFILTHSAFHSVTIVTVGAIPLPDCRTVSIKPYE